MHKCQKLKDSESDKTELSILKYQLLDVQDNKKLRLRPVYE